MRQVRKGYTEWKGGERENMHQCKRLVARKREREAGGKGEERGRERQGRESGKEEGGRGWPHILHHCGHNYTNDKS